MIGIETITYHLGQCKIDNRQQAVELGASNDLLENKIGMTELSRLSASEDTADLAEVALGKLFSQNRVSPEDIECLVVVTQNPTDHGLPHTSAILHGRFNFSKACAAFDISLGCSGYVYGLSIVSSFMMSHGMTKGLLITADPYSKILNPADRNTALLFGDGAAVSLLSTTPNWRIGKFDFGTDGTQGSALRIDENRQLTMNGRAVFNFSALTVPESVQRTLDINNVALSDIDQIVLHQGSRFIVDTIAQRLGAEEKTKFFAQHYGNLVSSSIPVVLADNMQPTTKTILLSGFGVGLSWASTILFKE